MLFEVKISLHRLLNSDNHGDGHTDHGIAACIWDSKRTHISPYSVLASH